MDAIAYLIEDHDRHRKLLSLTEKDHSKFSELKDDFVHHVNIEEAVFYPNLLKVPELESIVREAWEEHSLCMQLIQEMDGPQISKKMWESKFAVFKKLSLSHLEHEETELFPRIRKLASEEFLLEVGHQMLIQKHAVATDDILYPDQPGMHKLQD